MKVSLFFVRQKFFVLSLLLLIVSLSPGSAALAAGVDDIWSAAEFGDTAAIALQIARGADINGYNKFGKTPLMAAINYGRGENVKFIISKGADIAAADRHFGMTALHYASQYGYIDIVKTLAAAGADPKAKNGEGVDALAVAVKYGNVEIAKYYLELKMNADTIVLPMEGGTLLMYAAGKGMCDMVDLLLAHGADKKKKSDSGMKAADYASATHNDKLISLLSEKGEKLFNAVDAATLTYGAYAGSMTLLKNALDAGADPNVSTAITRGQVSDHSVDVLAHIYGEMLNTGISIPESITPLIAATATGHLEAVKLLIARGAKPDFVPVEGCHTPLMIAINMGKYDVAAFLIESGADVNARSVRGETPLMLAAHVGAPEIVGALVKKGADVNAADNKGTNALTYALRSCDPEIIKIFKDKGCDLKKVVSNLGNGRDVSLIENAIKLENLDMVKTFLEFGVDPNSNTLYESPVFFQLTNQRCGNYAIAKLFLDRGANVMVPARPDSSVTALSSAIDNSYVELVKLFVERGCKLSKNLRIHGRSNRLRSFFEELGLVVADEQDQARAPWDVKGFPYELGMKIRPEYRKLMRQTGSSYEPPANIEKAEKENIDIKGPNGQTALQYIVARQNYENIARLLIENGADVNTGDGWSSPLERAIRDKNYGFVEYILSKGANVNLFKPDVRESLLAAVESGERKIYDLMLSKGADLKPDTNAFEEDYYTNYIINNNSNAGKSLALLLDLADRKKIPPEKILAIKDKILQYGNSSLIKVLYENKLIRLDKIDAFSIISTLKGGITNAMCIAGLLKISPSDFYDGVTKYYIAINRNNENNKADADCVELCMTAVKVKNAEYAKYFYAKIAEPEFKLKSSIVDSCMHSADPAMIEFGADVLDPKDISEIYSKCNMAHGGDSSVDTLVKAGRIDLVKKLLAKHPGLKRRYISTSLIYPVLVKKDMETLKYLIANIDDISRDYSEGKKITEWLMNNKDEKIAAMLEAAGIDVKGRFGAEILQDYIRRGRREEFIRSFESGVGSDFFKREGLSYLFSTAINTDEVEFASYLIGRGVSVNEKDYVSDALGNGKVKMAQYLVSRGAEYKDLKAALNYAIRNEDYEMIDFIFSRGHKTDYELYGETPALNAVKTGKLKLVEKLIEKGICLKSPFRRAGDSFRPGASDRFDFGGMRGISKKEERSTLLNFAIDGYDSEMAVLLAKHAGDINDVGTNGKCALELAVEKNFTEVALEIIKRKEFDAGAKGVQKAFSTAVLTENAPVIAALIEKGVNKAVAVDNMSIKEAVERDGFGAVLAATVELRRAGKNVGEIYKTLMEAGVSSGEVLLGAIKLSADDLVDFAIAAGAAVNYVHSDGRTPLAAAIERGNAPVADKLLARGADANRCDSYQRPLIVLAVQKCGAETVKALTGHGAKLDAATPFGLTALYAALRAGKTDSAKCLTDAGADVKKAMIAAVCEKNMAAVKFLLDNGADPNASSGGIYPLPTARKAGAEEIVNLLIARGAKAALEMQAGADEEFFKKLEQNCNSADKMLELIKILPDVNVKNSRGQSLLEVRLNSTFRPEVIKYLIERGVNLNDEMSNGDPVFLGLISYNEYCALIKDKIDQFDNIAACNQAGQNALFLCNDVEMIRKLVKKGLDVNLKDNRGYTPLMWKCRRYSSAPAIKTLIDCGADVKMKTSDGKTLLMLIAAQDNSATKETAELIKSLHSLGIDVNAKDNSGGTALHYACSRDDKSDIVGALLSLGADLNAVNAKDQTALAYAIADNYSMKVPMMLIKAGANLDIDAKNPLKSRGMRDLMACRNPVMLKFLIEKIIDRLPEINEEFIKTLLTNNRYDNAITAILFIAKKRGTKHEILWALLFEKMNSAAGEDMAQIVFKNCDYELIKFLAAKGVNLEYKNNYRNALEMAAEAGNGDALKYLLEDVKMKADSAKIQKLIYAINYRSAPAMTYLIGKLGATDEILIRENVSYNLIYNNNIEGLNELVNCQKDPKKKHDWLMSALEKLARNNRREDFKNTYNTFSPLLDSADVELIKRNGWQEYLY